MYYELHDSIDLDLKSTPIKPIQTTRMANMKSARNVNSINLGSHTVSFLR